MANSAPQLFCLDNGVRIVVEPFTHVQSAAIGLWCLTGSRHEREGEAGITHLIEHMLFKGTENRTAKQIVQAIEGRGGVLNAFTDKESTCYYCRVLSEDVANGVDVLTDMIRHSLIDSNELEREKRVVLEEIKRSEDEPDDQVHDLHFQNRWPSHVLGKPVIGTKESVSSFERGDLVSYIDRRYRGNTLLLSVAGNVDPNAFRDLVEARLGDLPAEAEETSVPRPRGAGGSSYVEKDVEQVHFCVGTDGVSLYDDDLYVQAVMDNAMGGGMSSRLFQEIRERRGLAYAIGSYSSTYTVGGAWTIYGGTGKQTWDEVLNVVHAELAKLRHEGLTDAEIEASKLHLRGHIVMGLEGMSARMMRNARNQLFHKRHIPIEETVGKIDEVTNSDIVAHARRIADPSHISITAIGPA